MKTIFLCLLIVCVLFAFTWAQCPNACPFIYNPVCAGPPGETRGVQMFDNDCALEVYNCEHQTAWVKYEGSC
uniref:Uncharacterized protein n=1 Tax=Phlebotomus papatasi TaxID=29031 RepID=A0A1B0EZL2_PHLPP